MRKFIPKSVIDVSPSRSIKAFLKLGRERDRLVLTSPSCASSVNQSKELGRHMLYFACGLKWNRFRVGRLTALEAELHINSRSKECQKASVFGNIFLMSHIWRQVIGNNINNLKKLDIYGS
jgi:hypothetical protein